MKYLVLDKRLDYDGTQLRSLFAYMGHGILGDSIVAFRGTCDVSFEHMVDGEDLLAKSKICGSDMVHFVVEHFQMDLPEAVSRQRLLAAMVKDVVEKMSGMSLLRDGDDLFLEQGKFSISIATKTPVSSLIHFAFNVSNEGTPVKTASLQDLRLSDWSPIALKICKAYVEEHLSIKDAACKVRWVP